MASVSECSRRSSSGGEDEDEDERQSTGIRLVSLPIKYDFRCCELTARSINSTTTTHYDSSSGDKDHWQLQRRPREEWRGRQRSGDTALPLGILSFIFTHKSSRSWKKLFSTQRRGIPRTQSFLFSIPSQDVPQEEVGCGRWKQIMKDVRTGSLRSQTEDVAISCAAFPLSRQRDLSIDRDIEDSSFPPPLEWWLSVFI